jgi:hypothetical protein
MTSSCQTNSTPLNDTWTRKSSLNPSSWYPFPELLPEKYTYSSNTCNKYVDHPPLDGLMMKKENYIQTCAHPGSYMNSQKTWESQKPYTL